jgi:diadenosine tetraphosphatase ApaH/serine/threonine PP2A family protein phosphatase
MKDKYYARCPHPITDAIIEFAMEIADSDKLVYVPIQPQPFAERGKCYNNAFMTAAMLGGEPILGWMIWSTNDLFLTAEHHCVVKMTDGSFVDPTPDISGESHVLFVPSGEEASVENIERITLQGETGHYKLLVKHPLLSEVVNQLDAAASFNYQHTSLCFIGHTHSPKAYVRDGSVRIIPLDVLALQRGKKYLINVGSVGQPRDGDWRAAYCIYDTTSNEVQLRRLEYDLAGAQKAIVEAGLPRRLAERLAVGR